MRWVYSFAITSIIIIVCLLIYSLLVCVAFKRQRSLFSSDRIQIEACSHVVHARWYPLVFIYTLSGLLLISYSIFIKFQLTVLFLCGVFTYCVSLAGFDATCAGIRHHGIDRRVVKTRNVSLLMVSHFYIFWIFIDTIEIYSPSSSFWRIEHRIQKPTLLTSEPWFGSLLPFFLNFIFH